MSLEIIRHSTAHLMAQAVKRLYKNTKIAIGPSTEDGFYYDFDLDVVFDQESLKLIEKEMKKIVAENLDINRIEMTKEEAIGYFKKKGETYKVNILEDIPEKVVSLYRQGEFTDLCKGPHVDSTSKLGAFKLSSVAGAYWRGDEKNRMLQRIYGYAFGSKEDLDKYVVFLEEVKKRDHRKLGKELDLYSVSDSVGAGLILWLPKGAIIREIIETDLKERQKSLGYSFVYSPHIARSDLWRTSGHLDFYQGSMFPAMDIEGVSYLVKPMNCPFHTQVYKNKIRSYRDLPIRMAELGTVYRCERSGTLHGLLRVRGFTQDDAHIFCTENILVEEIGKILDLMLDLYRQYHFEQYEVFVSTRPERFVGEKDKWDMATEALKEALSLKSIGYSIDPGEGVFYGPKIDVKILDSLKRRWQCTTIQVDFNLPERFGLEYVDAGGGRKVPIMLHRALLGSLERFFGILIEHYAGHFPFWLAPVQSTIVPVSDEQLEFARSLEEHFSTKGIRISLDDTNKRLGAKIRQAELLKVPSIMVVGNKEVEMNAVNLRIKGSRDRSLINIEDLTTMFIKANKTRVRSLQEFL